MTEKIKQKTEDIMQYIPAGIHKCRADESFTLVSISEGFYELLGYTSQEIKDNFNNGFANMIYPADLPAVRENVKNQLAGGDFFELEYRMQKKGGTVAWFLGKCRMVRQKEGDFFYCLLLDITNQRREKEELRLSLERYQVIMDQATDIIFEWDIRKDVLQFSSNWVKKFGYEPIKEEIRKRVPESVNIHREDMAAFVRIMEDTARGVPYSEAEFRIRDSEGCDISCRVRATTQYDSEKNPIKAIGVITDVSRENRQKQELLNQAQTDSLTGLLNRKSGRDRIEKYLKENEQGEGVLLLLDLDDFKMVNDSYGHLWGDTVLSNVAEELRRHFRAGDVISRIGGDEFMIFLPEITEQAAEQKVSKLEEGLNRLRVDTKPGIVSCSVGGAWFPKHARDYYGLYKCADQALYAAKNQGKRKFVMYGRQEERSRISKASSVSCVNAAIDSEENFTAGTALEQYCFQVLYNAVDIPQTIGRILEKVGKFYHVSRVYIFEEIERGKTCSNTFEWCDKGISPEIKNLQNLRYGVDLGNYQDNFNEEGIFYCRDMEELDEITGSMLKKQGIQSVLQCAMKDCGVFFGFVGFDECREKRAWTKQQMDSLAIISRILSTFLTIYHLKEKR